MDFDLDDILSGLTAAPTAASRLSTLTPPQQQKLISLPFKDASTKWRNGASLDEQILSDNLDGVIFKRIPMPIPDFENYRSIPSYNYHATNGRSVEVKIVISFNPSNVVLIPGATAVLQGSRVVEIYLKSGEASHICTCEPADKRADTFDPFNADVLVYPSHGETKVEELQDVKLFTRIEYGEQTRVEFEALNGKHYEVVVEVSPQGEILSKSGPIPMRATVRPGERVRVGYVTCTRNISSSWRWETSPTANLPRPRQESTVQTTEAKGVFLTKKQTPGEKNLLEFELENTLGTHVIAEIELTGSQIDWYGKTNPLRVPVKARSKASGGSVTFKGDIAIAFGWKEDK